MERLFDDVNEFDNALSEAIDRASVEDMASKMDRQFVLDNVIPELLSFLATTAVTNMTAITV